MAAVASKAEFTWISGWSLLVFFGGHVAVSTIAHVVHTRRLAPRCLLLARNLLPVVRNLRPVVNIHPHLVLHNLPAADAPAVKILHATHVHLPVVKIVPAAGIRSRGAHRLAASTLSRAHTPHPALHICSALDILLPAGNAHPVGYVFPPQNTGLVLQRCSADSEVQLLRPGLDLLIVILDGLLPVLGLAEHAAPFSPFVSLVYSYPSRSSWH